MDELAALWRDEYARLLQEEEDERKAQGEAPSDRAEFKAWFLNHRMYHTLAPSLADAVCTSLDVPHTKKPSWVALHKALASWRMPAANTPNWLAQFMICFRRYLLKRLRLRKRLSAQLFFMILLAVVSGLGQGPDVPQTAVMLVGCISLFCTFITTCSIESVPAGRLEPPCSSTRAPAGFGRAPRLLPESWATCLSGCRRLSCTACPTWASQTCEGQRSASGSMVCSTCWLCDAAIRLSGHSS